jgi:hypothetical protein
LERKETMLPIIIYIIFFAVAVFGGIISITKDPHAWLQSEDIKVMSRSELKAWFIEGIKRHAWWCILAVASLALLSMNLD